MPKYLLVNKFDIEVNVNVKVMYFAQTCKISFYIAKTSLNSSFEIIEKYFFGTFSLVQQPEHSFSYVYSILNSFVSV